METETLEQEALENAPEAAGIDEQQRLVALRNQGKARQSQMILGLKECEKLFTDFI